MLDGAPVWQAEIIQHHMVCSMSPVEPDLVSTSVGIKQIFANISCNVVFSFAIYNWRMACLIR